MRQFNKVEYSNRNLQDLILSASAIHVSPICDSPVMESVVDCDGNVSQVHTPKLDDDFSKSSRNWIFIGFLHYRLLLRPTNQDFYKPHSRNFEPASIFEKRVFLFGSHRCSTIAFHPLLFVWLFKINSFHYALAGGLLPKFSKTTCLLLSLFIP